MRLLSYIALAAFFAVIALYLLPHGGKFVYYTDLAAALFSFLAAASSFDSWLELKNKHSQSLLLMLSGVALWSMAEIIWFLFPGKAYMVSESLRLIGYIPLSFGFFFILREAHPRYHEHRKYFTAAISYFALFALIYLVVLPMLTGQKVWDRISVNGYIFADFILLFGVIILLVQTYKFWGTSMSNAWLAFAMAFMSAFAFDLFFALFPSQYNFGHPSELLIILNYALIALGFALMLKEESK